MVNLMLNRSMKVIFMVIMAGVFVACGSKKESSSGGEAGAAESPSEEQAVEQARFVDLDGDMIPITRFEGKVVLIDFWETWCKPCLASFPTMQKLIDDYPDDFVVLAVTPGFSDTREDAREFKQEHDYDFVYLYDENKLHEKLNVQGIPFKVFVDAEGEFIEASLGSRGPDGDYKHAEEIIQEHRGS